MGDEMEMVFAYYETALGLLELGVSEARICMLRFADARSAPHMPSAVSEQAAHEVQEYLAGMRRSFTVPVQLAGTAFRQACWRAVQQIPYGETRTYGEIAAALGKPGAARAVGAAMAANPVWLIVPCHRVLGANGTLTGYAGGTERKRRLLELEQAENFGQNKDKICAETAKTFL